MPAEPGCEEEGRAKYNDEEYVKLISRIEKIKQKRQNEVENDKKWSEMDDENDEMIEWLNRLKPVELVSQPDPDIEFMKKEEEIERQKDEYFDKKEQFERMRDEYLDKKDWSWPV